MPVYTYNTIEPPTTVRGEAQGINDTGQIVGSYRRSLI
jgi:hypothetical protein